MSSTNRGAKRQDFDYYVTDPRHVAEFLRAWTADDARAAEAVKRGYVLDPCAGGNTTPREWEYKPGHVTTVPVLPCSYGVALREFGCLGEVIENDIRADSPAGFHSDFLGVPPEIWDQPDVVITNPAFSNALEVIQRSLEVVSPSGWVVMLLRLNFLGSDKRFEFFQRMMPERIYVHHKRMGFVPGKPSETDSVEYAHMVWRPWGGSASMTKVI